MMKRFILVGFGLSEPGTMGGNTKIALEIARNLSPSDEVHLIVPEYKADTVSQAIGAPVGLHLHVVPGFHGGDLRHPFASSRHYCAELHRVFETMQVGAGDVVYSCSDFHVDTVPCFKLQKRFSYRWVAVQFLFVPSFVENLVRGYRFPALKYILVWIYSNVLFRMARRRASEFVITNDSDRAHFPKGFQAHVFAFYGGVNVDQIPEGSVTKTRDVVFCSRLHPQKGIDGFLDIWKRVRGTCPSAHLTVIGNGEPKYERYLKDKAMRLGVADSIEWLGYVNNEAKYEIYRSARVMVHPTVFDNNGMVAAEALCSGLPVVMYDLAPLRDVYVEGCVKVPFGDRKAFASEVVRLLSDENARVAVAPSVADVATLRKKWNWPNRVIRFRRWLEDCGK